MITKTMSCCRFAGRCSVPLALFVALAVVWVSHFENFFVPVEGGLMRKEGKSGALASASAEMRQLTVDAGAELVPDGVL